MKVGLKEIDAFPAEVTIFEDKRDIGFAIDNVVFVGGITANLSIQQTETEYYITGVCAAKVDLECARCLESAIENISGEIDMIAIRENGSGERFADVEDVVELDVDEELDFSEQVRQAIFASLPLKPLCKTDCKGLCPTCGGNRNETACDCKRDTHDTRWDALKGLIE